LAGRRVDALVSAADYMTTFLAMLGVKHGLALDGKNFWDLATAKTDHIHDHVMTEFGQFAAVHDHRWHYFQNTQAKDALTATYVKQQAGAVTKQARGAPHLYDLESDPKETRNVVLDHPDVVAEMQERLRKRIQA